MSVVEGRVTPLPDPEAPRPFGFRVRKEGRGGPIHWAVELPHQCDEWQIGWGSSPDVADSLRRFLEEGQEALAALERGERFGRHPNDWDGEDEDEEDEDL